MNFFRWLASWWKPQPAEPPATSPAPRPADVRPVYFECVTECALTPTNDQVAPRAFYVVTARNEPYWALFRCPCECGEVVNLPLRSPHSPRWRVTTDNNKRPSLRPSVWRNKGCCSHYWVDQGRIIWTSDTGLAPSLARPDLYSDRLRHRPNGEP